MYIYRVNKKEGKLNCFNLPVTYSIVRMCISKKSITIKYSSSKPKAGT